MKWKFLGTSTMLCTMIITSNMTGCSADKVPQMKKTSVSNAIDNAIIKKLKNVSAKNLKKAVEVVHKMVEFENKKEPYPIEDYIYAAEIINEGCLMLGENEIDNICNFERGTWSKIVSKCNKSGKMEKIDLVSILQTINADLGNNGTSKKHIDFFEFESRVVMEARCYDAHRYFNPQLSQRLWGLIDNQALRDKLFDGLSLAFCENYIDKVGKHALECDDLETGDLSDRVRVIDRFIEWVTSKITSNSSHEKACETLLKEVKDYEWK